VTEVPPEEISTSLSAPSLNIEYLTTENLSGDGPISPGNQLRLTIEFRNAENATSATVEQVQASYDSRVVEA
jgi:hypothetical protein